MDHINGPQKREKATVHESIKTDATIRDGARRNAKEKPSSGEKARATMRDGSVGQRRTLGEG